MASSTTGSAQASPRALRLQLLPLVIAVIVTTTMIPEALRRPSLLYIDASHAFNDVLGNILLYMPLGFFLRASSLGKKVFIGFLISLCAETLQLFYVHRTPSPVDLTTNTLGTLFGAVLALLWTRAAHRVPRTLVIPRSLGWLGIPAAILFGLILLRRGTISDLSNWDPTFNFALGNELNGERPWSGTIFHLAIYPAALNQQQLQTLAQIPITDRAFMRRALTALHPVLLLPSPVQLDGSLVTPLQPAQEGALFKSVSRRGKLTVAAWIEPESLHQTGPARIVTYSRDAHSRNFTLGQIGDALTFRLRTTTNNWNGTEPALTTGRVLTPGQAAFVAAVYDGRISRLYVNGSLAASVDLGAERPQLPRRVEGRVGPYMKVDDLELIASEVIISGTFVLGVFSLLGALHPRSTLLWVALVSSAALALWICTARVSSHHLALRIFLECIGGGLVVWAAVQPPEPYNGGHESRIPSPAAR